jgi:hypothetical protein
MTHCTNKPKKTKKNKKTTKTGSVLSLQSYMDFAKKRSTLRESTKQDVYTLFTLYERLKRIKGAWDEGDLAYRLYCR